MPGLCYFSRVAAPYSVQIISQVPAGSGSLEAALYFFSSGPSLIGDILQMSWLGCCDSGEQGPLPSHTLCGDVSVHRGGRAKQGDGWDPAGPNLKSNFIIASGDHVFIRNQYCKFNSSCCMTTASNTGWHFWVKFIFSTVKTQDNLWDNE